MVLIELYNQFAEDFDPPPADGVETFDELLVSMSSMYEESEKTNDSSESLGMQGGKMYQRTRNCAHRAASARISWRVR